MTYKLELAFAAAFTLAAFGTFLSPDSAEAFPGNNALHYVCYHNDMPYTLVFVPPGASPNCPDLDTSNNPIWDVQDGLDCDGLEGLVGCLKKRHIDCEYESERGDL